MPTDSTARCAADSEFTVTVALQLSGLPLSFGHSPGTAVIVDIDSGQQGWSAVAQHHAQCQRGEGGLPGEFAGTIKFFCFWIESHFEGRWGQLQSISAVMLSKPIYYYYCINTAR